MNRVDKIKRAVAKVKAQGKEPSVRMIAKATGISESTIKRHNETRAIFNLPPLPRVPNQEYKELIEAGYTFKVLYVDYENNSVSLMFKGEEVTEPIVIPSHHRTAANTISRLSYATRNSALRNAINELHRQVFSK